MRPWCDVIDTGMDGTCQPVLDYHSFTDITNLETKDPREETGILLSFTSAHLELPE